MFWVGAHLLAQVVPQFLFLQFSRASRMLYLGLLPLAAAGIAPLFSGTRMKQLVGVVCVGLLAAPLPLFAGGFLPTTVSSNTEQLLDAQLVGDPHDASAAFLDVAHWAKEHTAVDALFLAPPNGFALWFRTVAERSVVVAQKDGSNMIITQPDGGAAWYARYKGVRAAYLQNQTSVFADTAKKYGAQYVIADNAQKLDLPIVYENRAFTMYEMTGAYPISANA